MERTKLGPQVSLYPMPVTLVGTMFDGKPNFSAVSWVSRVNGEPPMIAISLNNAHHSPKGIARHKTFSVNLPSRQQLVVTDYCGCVSGARADKSELFDVFHGELDGAPMVADFPLCMECELVRTVELPTHTLFVGKIREAWTEPRFLSDGKLDVKKMDPLTLTMPDNGYWSVGERVGRAWHDGKRLAPERTARARKAASTRSR